MPHTHAETKADACHDAIEEFKEKQHHSPDIHEKARILSNTIKEWEHEHVENTHAPVLSSET